MLSTHVKEMNSYYKMELNKNNSDHFNPSVSDCPYTSLDLSTFLLNAEKIAIITIEEFECQNGK